MYADASFTIEAAFVVPLIIFGIMAMIFLVFYLHNQVAVISKADMQIFIMEYDEARNDYGSVSLEASFRDDAGVFFGATVDSAVMRREGRKMNVEMHILQNVPRSGLMGSMIKNIRDIELIRKTSMPDRTETTRLIKAVGEMAEDVIKSLKKDKEKKTG